MIEKISDKILDILQSDSRLYAGGNAYAAGWTGVLRPDADNVSAQAGYVNLFDKPHDDDANTHRPAVYLGSKAMEASDSLDFVTQNGNRVEYRILIIPLFVCAMAGDKFAARKQRNQLRNNIKQILFSQVVLDGYWYELTIPGQSGGGMLSERVWTSGTGGASQQVAEAMAVVPVQVRYSYSVGCDA